MNVSTWCMWSACLLGLDRQYLQSLLLRSGVGIPVLQSLLPPQVSVPVEVAPLPLLFTAGCVWLFSPPCTPGVFLAALCSSPEQWDIKLDGRKAISPQRSLCQSSVVFFPLVAVWLKPFTPPTHPAVEISSCPALSTGNLLLEGAFFCTKCYKSFTPEMDSALHFNFPANERESYPVEYYFLPLSLLAVTHFLPTL